MSNINLIKLKFFIIFLIAIILFPINSNSEEILIKPDDIGNYCDNFSKDFLIKKINKVNSLEINFDDDRAWIKNSIQIITSGSDNILRKFKKRFKANITVNFDENIQCNFRAKIRQHGDKLDHINYRDGIFRQSMDVELINGNIFGITQFKLINPESRNRKNELIFISFLEEMGLLAPRTFFTNAKVLDKETTYIFQEKIVKEFLEFNNYREGPLIEGDERFMFVHTKSKDSKKKYLILTKLKNAKWSKRSLDNFYTSIDALSRLNYLYLSGVKEQIEKIKFANIELPDQKKDSTNNIFEAIMFASHSTHGLHSHNRTFYFNPITYEFLPIYYDGLVKFYLSEFNEVKVSQSAIDGSLNTIKLLNKVDNKKIQNKVNSSLPNITLKEITKIKKILIKNLENISKIKLEKNESDKIINRNFFNFNKEKYRDTNLVFFNNKNNVFYICDINIKNCIEKNNTEKTRKNILLLPNVFVGFSNSNLNISFEPENFIWNKNFLFNKKTKILANENIKVKIENNKIIFNQTDYNGQVLIKDGNLENVTVIFNGDGQIKNNDFKKPITGCVTFYNLSISNLNFISNNANCEDALNIVKSKGNIKDIKINNSASDALDVDFSDLEINSITINEAKNDCVDFSYGNYSINSVSSKNCGDKGISIGENSRYEIDNYFSNYSKIGLASKDSSEGKITNLNFGKQVKLCIALYRKKQEFLGSLLNYSTLNCPSKNNYVSNTSQLNLIN